MQRFTQISRVAFASGIIALGVIGLVFHDFALVWGPLPSWVPWHTALAYLCAVVPLVAGVALLSRRTWAAASLVLFVYVALWWLLIKVPGIFRSPLTEGRWLAAGMTGLLLSGAWTLFADVGEEFSLGGERGLRFARLFFGLALIPVGLSHFAYLSITIGLVPSWLPFRMGWAYLTGAAHIAAGLGVLFGILPKLAAQLEAAMLAIFTILVQVPAVVAAPAIRRNWTELWVSFALSAAAAVVAVHVPVKSGQLSASAS